MKVCIIREKCFAQNVDVVENESLKPPGNNETTSQCLVGLSPVPFLHNMHKNAKLALCVDPWDAPISYVRRLTDF